MPVLENSSLEDMLSISQRDRSVNSSVSPSVSSPASYKGPFSWIGALFWKLCLLSLCLHGAMVVLPLPQKPPLEDAESVNEASDSVDPSLAIPAVKLPEAALAQSELVDTSSSEAPISVAVPPPAPVASPAPVQPSVLPASVLPTELQEPIAQPAEQVVSPQTVDPLDGPSNSSDESTSQQPLQQTDDAFVDASETPSMAESLPLLGGEPEYGKVMPLSETFPHLADSQAGCYGLAGCRQLSGNFGSAARQLVAQMQADGYQLTQRDDIENTGHRVFEAIAPDEPSKIYYLNVFSPELGSTVYVVTTEILSLSELQQLSR